MRNVLIPTDFTTQSLQLVARSLEALDEQPTNIILFHAFEINCNAEDFLGSTRRLPYADVLTDEFRNGCRRLKTTFAKFVHQVNIRHMYGTSVSVFRNFIDANDIDVIIYPNNYIFQKVTACSVNPDKMFRKAGIPILHPVTRKSSFTQQSATPLAETLAVLIR